MDIKLDIETCLERLGWTSYRLAKESKVNLSVIRRVLRGQRTGLNSATLSRLWPFLYGTAAPCTLPSSHLTESQTMGKTA